MYNSIDYDNDNHIEEKKLKNYIKNNCNNHIKYKDSGVSDLSDNSQRDNHRKFINSATNLEDEKIRKFINGKIIVDQCNPFRYERNLKRIDETNRNELFNEPLNEWNDLKRNHHRITKCPSNEFITTEEVLNQSKYVKTYIKNPDPYFKYDPTILIRLKLEELKEYALKRPTKKRIHQPEKNHSKYSKNLKCDNNNDNKKIVPLTYKKCTKPNYPNLADLKIKTGASDIEEGFLNNDEISENVRKFDERVKTLKNISLTDDDDYDNYNDYNDDKKENSINHKSTKEFVRNAPFKDMIKSRDFQDYLKESGLVLQPKVPSNEQHTSETSNRKMKNHQVQFADDVELKGGNRKKTTVFRRLFPSRIFSMKSRNDKVTATAPAKPERLTYERRSYHGHTTLSKSVNNDTKRKSGLELTNGNSIGNLAEVMHHKASCASHRNESINTRPPPPPVEDHYDTFKENINSTKRIGANMPKNVLARNEEEIVIECNRMPTSSTPIKTEGKHEGTSDGSLKAKSIPQLDIFHDPKEWNKLKAIKERTDRELYQQILQHQKQLKREEGDSQTVENSQARLGQLQGNFVRNSPKRQSVPAMIHSSKHMQRNVFITKDGRAMSTDRLKQAVDMDCSRSVLDGPITQGSQARKVDRPETGNKNDGNRKIGGILTRDDILQKLKEFCRKSQNGSFAKGQKSLAPSEQYKQPIVQTGLSPVSYASVEVDPQSNSRNYTPQSEYSEQRKYSAGTPIPTTRHDRNIQKNSNKAESICESNVPNYAYVIKRPNERSKHSESITPKPKTGQYYEESKRDYKTAPLQSIYVKQNTLKYPKNECVPLSQQQILVNGENVLIKPVQIINNFPFMNMNMAQYPYISEQQQQLQLQPLPPNYCYIFVTEPEIIQHHSTAIQPHTQLQLMPTIFYGNRNVPLRFNNPSPNPINQSVYHHSASMQ